MEKKQQGNILAIVIMFFLFAMISFVTGFQNPFGVIVKQQFAASNFMSQLGNAANFIAYAFMGLPAGMILSKKGYKFTALAAVTVGFVGVGVTFLSGIVGSFAVYILGAFISGFSMCMLNTVVNPMLNTLGGGGNKGNQLIQWGGSCNSLSATIVPVLVGYLIGDVTKDTQIADANPALFIAMGIFALAFIIIAASHIPEPELEAAAASGKTQQLTIGESVKGALAEIPIGVMFFILCGLCTSVMWGAIFNLAVEGLGKYTSIASGLFMVMVCGGGILPLIQGAVADATNYLMSYIVVIIGVAYILWYALFGSKVKKTA